MKKLILLAALLISGMGFANAKVTVKAVKASVGQGGAVLDSAQFVLSEKPTFQFDASGKLIMTLGTGTAHVAVLPITNGASMSVECCDLKASTNQKSVTVSSDGYATLYSAFQLEVPSTGDVEVYAPTYENGVLKANSTTKIAAGSVIPAGTGLLLVNAGDISFDYSAEAATATTSALSGSAIAIAKPVETGKTVYTLGHNSAAGHESEYAFFAYTGENMVAGKAYLLTETVSPSAANKVRISFDETNATTAIDTIEASASTSGKRFENGRLVIYRDGKKYSSTGILIK